MNFANVLYILSWLNEYRQCYFTLQRLLFLHDYIEYPTVKSVSKPTPHSVDMAPNFPPK